MRERLSAALKQAIQEDDKRRVSTLRLIKATIKDRDDAARGVGRDRVKDDDITGILVKMIKQRLESAEHFEAAGRLDVAQEERDEICILKSFLPEQLNEDQVRSVCAEAIERTGAAGLRDVGRCMQTLKSRYKGRMDFGKAGAVVRGMLR